MSEATRITTRCPHCKTKMTVPRKYVGQVASCPVDGCGQRFRVEPIESPPAKRRSLAEEGLDRENPFLAGSLSEHESNLEGIRYSGQPSTPIYHGTASNPGNVNASFLRWTWCHDFTSIVFFGIPIALGAVLLVAGSAFGVIASAVGGLLAVGGGAGGYAHFSKQRLYFRGIVRHFEIGDANPAVVVSVEPMLYAVFTDLTLGVGNYPVVKIQDTKLTQSGGRRLAIGDFFPTVATYSQPTEADMSHWSSFYPMPVDFVAGKKTVERVMATFGKDHYRNLMEAIKHVPKPYEPGLFVLWPEPGKKMGRRAEFTPEAKQAT